MREVEKFRNDKNINKQELKIFDIMLRAIEEELNVNAYLFEGGKCIDISCIQDATVLWNQQNACS